MATSATRTLGYTDEEAQRVADDIDVVINSAGNVTFNPTLESALRTNVVGTQNVIAFTRRMKRPGTGACVDLFCGRQPLGRGLGARPGDWLLSPQT